MAHKKSDERPQLPSDSDDEKVAYLLDSQRIDLARDIMEFAKVAMANVQALAQPDQDIDPSRY